MGRSSSPSWRSGVGVARRSSLVTSIEILSPSNKKIGNPGREKFLEKQREVLDSETHLVEIDLLRGGTHTAGRSQGPRQGKGRPVRLPGLDPSLRSTQGVPRLSDRDDSAAPPDRHPAAAGRPRCAARPSGRFRPVLRFRPLSSRDRVRQGSDRASLETRTGQMGRRPAQAAKASYAIDRRGSSWRQAAAIQPPGTSAAHAGQFQSHLGDLRQIALPVDGDAAA